MIAALNDAGRGYDGQLGILLKVGDGENTAVAHGGFDLVEALCHVVAERTCVGNVGINALLKAELCLAAEVIALPIARSVGAFAPIFLDISAVYHQFVGRAFVKAGEISAEHEEVGAHCESKGHVIVVNYAAVGADGHINAGFFIIFVSCGSDLDKSGSLSPAYALGLSGDADGAAADAFTKSAPAFARKRKPSLSTTLPAPTFTVLPYFSRINARVCSCHTV